MGINLNKFCVNKFVGMIALGSLVGCIETIEPKVTKVTPKDISKPVNKKDIASFRGEWGTASCKHPEAERTTCNKPGLVVQSNGVVQARVYDKNSGKIKSKANFSYVKVSENKLSLLETKNTTKVFGNIVLSKELGIDVLTVKFNDSFKKFKYVSTANLKRGYLALQPNGRVKVSKFDKEKYDQKKQAGKDFNTTLKTIAAVAGAIAGIDTTAITGPETSSVSNSGNGPNLANVKIGQVVPSVSMTDSCGLPLSAVSQGNRQAWYNETLKGNQTSAFQNNQSATREIMSISTPSGFGSVCEAAKAQVYAFLPSLNQAIQASTNLHNGTGVGLRCGASGASGSTACTATNIVYGLKIASYMCHQVCKAGK